MWSFFRGGVEREGVSHASGRKRITCPEMELRNKELHVCVVWFIFCIVPQSKAFASCLRLCFASTLCENRRPVVSR